VAGSSDGQFAVARYHTNGTLDTSFSNDGRFKTGYADGVEAAEAVAVQPDGKIVIAGWTDLNGSFDFAIARIDTGGTLDPPPAYASPASAATSSQSRSSPTARS
jgi:uncharacterized delta-60 repeat protein